MTFLNQEAIRAAFQSIKANRLRSVLTTLGIVIGVASVVMVVQLSKGLEARILAEIQKQGAHTFTLDSFRRGDTSWSMRIVPVDPLQIEELRRLVPQIRMASPTVTDWSNGPEVRLRGQKRTPPWQAIDENGLAMANLDLASGRNFTATDRIFHRSVVILGHGLADKLGLNADASGTFLTYGGQTVEVVGILKPQDTPFGGDDGGDFGPDAQVYFPYGAFRSLLNQEAYAYPSWQLHVDLSIPLEQAEDALRTNFRAVRGLKSHEEDNFGLESSAEQEKEVKQVTRVLMAASAGLMGISLLVGGIGVMNIMLVSVTERTREIGVRKAMGARRGLILTQFLVEAVCLCIVGGLIGLGLGISVGQLLSKLLLHHMAWPSLVALLLALFVPSLVGLFFGLYPAKRAASLDPIEALRYE